MNNMADNMSSVVTYTFGGLTLDEFYNDSYSDYLDNAFDDEANSDGYWSYTDPVGYKRLKAKMNKIFAKERKYDRELAKNVSNITGLDVKFTCSSLYVGKDSIKFDYIHRKFTGIIPQEFADNADIIIKLLIQHNLRHKYAEMQYGKVNWYILYGFINN